ncbi:interferon-induced very large GTPase 1-like [Solea senegalensis]|uniref:Interferon-induced very large GTPase 1-like n=1 Tax=Solea senegalensis TaxID=28829 RepID=A0AAV6RK74_SOLSE|nr:interferon-induced very large GTPase 1-like [Solea senegalensis]
MQRCHEAHQSQKKQECRDVDEAHQSQKKQECRDADWFKYPELAAELMISGHPMELIDGDAGNVPLTWISSLLDEVIKKLGDKRVFVLSVLGIQSSGKSTMLNAMFGLEFAVSAGRCTKGAFMQLVKVSEEVKEKFTFDYILVVDTEGLRALELGHATLHHDNELATFVVGLGNITLINIFGENPAEMQDILQIVVQAFMRMKKVNLSPSCMFVHQNVTDITAVEKTMDGKRRLQDKLDQMAQLAAKEEVFDVDCFSDVIAFDVEKDVKYLAQLWEGSPPMAPPNPDYCESVQELRNMILSKASDSAGITLSQFKTKIQDLWNALVKENFVFNFKNTFEIAVYRNLEVQFGKWTWNLRSNMLTIENQQYNCIENGNTDKVELKHLYEEMSKTYEKTKEEIQKYFDHDKDKEILVQWRGRFESKINDFHEELVKETKRKLDEIIQQKNACKKLNDEKTVFENKLLQKSKELAHQLKDKGQEEKELKMQFDHVWEGWVDELTSDTKPIEDIDFEKEQNKVLTDLGIEWYLMYDSKRYGRHKELPVCGTYSDYITPKTLVGKIKKLIYYDHEHIRSFIARVEQQSIDNIKTKPVITRGFQSTYLQEVANNVIKEVTELEAELKCKARKEFKVDLILYVFDRATIWLSESHKKFKMNNDAIAYLEGKKTQYYDIFKSFCKGHSSAVVFGKVICEKLRSATAQAVFTKTAIDLAGEMKCNFPAFNGNRLVLEKHVLKSLAEKGSFKDYINYIQQPRKHVESYIEEQVKEYIFTDHEDRTMDIRGKNAEDIKRVVNQALFTASKNVKTQRGSTDLWLKEFSSLLKDELTIGDISSENFSDITNFDFLKDEIKTGFESIIEETNKRPLNEMKESRLKPEKILIDQLCNCCWVTCPFCAAVCTNTLKYHSQNDHSAPFHRSTAVNGWHYRYTVKMSVDFCTTKVASNGSFYPDSSERVIPYKWYRTGGPKYASWNITPDDSELPYWKWFICQYQNQLEEHYKLKFEGLGKIPENWKKISKEEAIKSLDELFNL